MKAKKQGAVIYMAIFSALMAFSASSCGFLPEDEEKKVSSGGKNTQQTDNASGGQGSSSDEAGPSSDGTTNEVVTEKEGLRLVWNDEFDYSGVPDPSKWKYQTGKSGWGNNEAQNYIANETEAKTAIVENGLLKIKAYHDGREWKSARMNSKASWKYGLIEARMKVTDKKGAWPAFWMMPQNSVYGTWPKSGEIDIMENAPATCGDHVVFSTLHAEGHSGGNGKSIGRKEMGSNLSNKWHTLAVKWDEEKITAYYDGVAQGSYKNKGSGYYNWPYDEDFYIILNLAIGGTLGGDTSGLNRDGVEFLIDYVRVYQ